MISVEAALEKTIAERGEPVISAYTLYVELWGLYRTQKFRGEPIRVRKSAPTFSDYTKIIGRLLDRRILKADTDFTKNSHGMESQQDVFRITTLPDIPAEDVCALIDPFCAVSYLSAMQRHAITNRNPSHLILATPATAIWRNLREERMRIDYGTRNDSAKIKTLDFIPLPEKLRGRPIERHQVKYPPQSVKVQDSFARVAKIGDTFEQTLDEPEWCGGIRHVLDVWEKYARPYLTEIIEAVERSPKSIIKVRAGYILDERLGIKNPKVENWLQYAQRGGSRRLNPSEAYKPIFSEKWMISINV
jgi:predicted transcriptional regulator of viral defense system